MNQFKHVALFSRRKQIAPIAETLKSVYAFLQQKKINVVWDQVTADALGIINQPTFTVEEIGKHCDLLIVVGGDGSLLGAANALVDYDIPVIGINRGKLGFLTDILPEQITEKLNEILAGNYKQEERFLLYAEIQTPQEKVLAKHTALNEVSLYAAHAARLMEFEVYINEQFVFNQRSDGLIIATPTGSTAYALSGGGPILHPSLECIVLVPMLPHALTSRPIVIDSSATIDVVITKDIQSGPDVSWDGQHIHSLHPQDRIRIRRHAHRLKILHPSDYDYYQTLRTKLQWGSKLTPKQGYAD
jgi:NAD+ kinase